jgi:hypothetical protein
MMMMMIIVITRIIIMRPVVLVMVPHGDARVYDLVGYRGDDDDDDDDDDDCFASPGGELGPSSTGAIGC